MSDDGTGDDVAALRTIADHQFGPPAGEALFPAGEDRTVKTTSSGRVSQVLADAGRLVSLGIDGRFTLGIEGGRRLDAALEYPAYRVAVGGESAPYVREGRNAFAKFVRDVDAAVRPGDEVLVVDDETPAEGWELLGVGTAELSADAMADFGTGMAVDVREGAGD